MLLTQTVVKFAIAWSWRDSINAFIAAIYGNEDNGNPIGQQWGYFITIALFVSVAFSFSEQFYILYPKSLTSGKLDINDPNKVQEFINNRDQFLKDKARIQVNDVIYDNFRFVVGMALFDALMKSLQSLGEGDTVSNGVQCFLYWLVAISGISLSIVGTHYVEKWGLRNKIANKGMAQAMFDTFERFYDPSCELHEEGDADLVPMILDTTLFELVYVTVFGLGIAGSMGTTNAIKFTINSINSASGYYDINNPGSSDEVHGSGLIWVSFFICLAISTLITGYFARMVAAAKKARRDLFEQFKEQDKKEEEREKAKRGKQQSKRFSLLGDDDDDKEEEDDSSDDVSSLDEDDENRRKRVGFSTKAEDAAIVDADAVAIVDVGDDGIGGDDDGGDDGIGGGDDGGGDDGGGDDGGGDDGGGDDGGDQN